MRLRDLLDRVCRLWRRPGYRQAWEGAAKITSRQKQEIADLQAKLATLEAVQRQYTALSHVADELARRPDPREYSRDLANILTGFQLIWERVKSLDAKLGGTLWDKESPSWDSGAANFWQVEAGPWLVRFDHAVCHGPGCCSLTVEAQDGSVADNAGIPVTPKMTQALRDFLESIRTERRATSIEPEPPP